MRKFGGKFSLNTKWQDEKSIQSFEVYTRMWWNGLNGFLLEFSRFNNNNKSRDYFSSESCSTNIEYCLWFHAYIFNVCVICIYVFLSSVTILWTLYNQLFSYVENWAIEGNKDNSKKKTIVNITSWGENRLLLLLWRRIIIIIIFRVNEM